VYSTAIAIDKIRYVAKPKAKPKMYPHGARLTKSMVARVVAIISEEMDHLELAQRAAAPRFFMSQAALNRLLKQHAGLGVDALLGLRLYFHSTGREVTIDDILFGAKDDSIFRRRPTK